MNSGSRSRLGWSTAFKIAWRESRASSTQFLFVVVAVALGVGSLAGVRGFSRAFQTMLLREARTLMAADLSVRVFYLPDIRQMAVVDELRSRGVAMTQVTETVSMMASDSSPDPVLVSVKAVDPLVYPFYGEVKLEPAASLAATLSPDSIAVSEDLLVRLRMNVGDAVRLGGRQFRVAAIVRMEPDRLTGSLNVGPRVMITRQALEETGLIRPGSRAAQRLLFRLPATGNPTVAEVYNTLNRTFHSGLIADYRETHPLVTRALDRSTTFLSLVSLVAVIVGALGVATAMQAHIRQKLDVIAIMKSMGATSGGVIRIYVVQTLLLAGLGAAIGLLLGFFVQSAFPALISRYLPLRPEMRWDWWTSIQTLAVGVVTTLLFTVTPLLSVRQVRPILILRRDMEDVRQTRRGWWKDLAVLWATGTLVLCGVAVVASMLTGGTGRDAFRTGAFFVGGVAVSLVVMGAFAWLLLRALRLVMRTAARAWPASLRHGMANLYRPGNQAAAVLVALGLGVMFTLTIYLVQRSVVTQIVNSAPPGMPNVFLINVTERERAGLLELLRATPGVQGQPELVGAVAVRITAVNGTPGDKLGLRGGARRLLDQRGATWSARIPADTTLVKGAWWPQDQPAGSPVFSISENSANILKVEPGDTVTFTVTGRVLTARLAAVHRTESVRPGSTVDFIFSPTALGGVPTQYFGGLRVDPPQVARLQRAAYERFPSITVINVADVVEIVQQVVDQIALVIRFVSFFAILAGAVILASSVAGSRFRRVREVVILKTLGATRGRVARIFAVEFSILGLAAGVMGSLLASGFSRLLLERLLRSDYHFDLLPNLAAVAITIGIANAAGWLAGYRMLSEKPLEVLRNE